MKNHLSIICILLGWLLLAGRSMAQDELTICDAAAIEENVKTCLESFMEDTCNAFKDPRLSNIYQTPEQVIESARQYFSGKQPTISTLPKIIANRNMGFCSRADQTKTLNGLLEMKKNGVHNHKANLRVFIETVQNAK